jgi:hypothetical protein
VVCVTNANCAAPTPVCDGEQCVECAADRDCHDPTLPFCRGGRCAQCNNNHDCTDPTLPQCRGGVCSAR